MQAEELVGRKVSYVVLHPDEAENHLLRVKPQDLLPLWNNEDSKLLLNHSAHIGK